MGTPLTIAKTATTDLDLTWGLGCSPDAIDYTVHEGTIGTYYSHDAVVCEPIDTRPPACMHAAAEAPLNQRYAGCAWVAP